MPAVRVIQALGLIVVFLIGACSTPDRPIPAGAPGPHYSSQYRRGQAPPDPDPRPTREPAPTDPLALPQPPPIPARQPMPDKYAHLPQGKNVALLEIRGMNCPTKCTREVKEQLSEAPGVGEIIIDFTTKVAIVRMDEGADRSVLARYVRPPYSAHLLR